MKTKQSFILMLVLICMLCILSACSSSNITGQWYNEDGKCLDIRADGSWKLEDSYGTGTWKKLNNNVFEFTDFYGDTQESLIYEDEIGKYIDFGYYGDFYKDKYPSKEEPINTEEIITEIETKPTIEIDPFENLSYEVSGISPYCQIAINDSKCSDEVQQYVTYSLDKEYYSNDDTAIITATLSGYTEDKIYVLKSSESRITVIGQPEYITSADQIDENILTTEVNDKITSLISSSIGTNELCKVSDYDILDYEYLDANFYMRNGITSVTPEYKESYLSVLKSQRENLFLLSDVSNPYHPYPYNMYSYIYCFDVQGDVNDVICYGKLFVNITAKNIIKYPDGTIDWDNGNCSFEVTATVDGLENCIASTVMKNSESYNISKIN